MYNSWESHVKTLDQSSRDTRIFGDETRGDEEGPPGFGLIRCEWRLCSLREGMSGPHGWLLHILNTRAFPRGRTTSLNIHSAFASRNKGEPRLGL